MISPNMVEAVPGTHDVPPDGYAALSALHGTLFSHFEAAGCQPVETPLLEHSELYLRQSGEEIVARMVDFSHGISRLCLRPEMTASIIRAYLHGWGDQPGTVRLCYSGPVFRYDEAGQGRYYQFTQAGAELIGAAGPAADAEMIALACRGLERAGLAGYRARIGHVGLLLNFLAEAGVQKQVRSFLIFNMENLHQAGFAAFAERLHWLVPAFQAASVEALTAQDASPPGQDGLPNGLTEADARTAVGRFLRSLNVEQAGGRSQAEIIDRMLEKLKQRDQLPRLHRAVRFMWELGRLSGPPAEVLSEARALCRAYDLAQAPLDALETTFHLLWEGAGLPAERFELDFGMSRGLQYYTGVIFELFGPGGDEAPLCGGGRYDDLISTLGGAQRTPAGGFAYPLEALHQALMAGGTAPQPQPAPIIYLRPADEGAWAATIRAAEALRAGGIRAALSHADEPGQAWTVLSASQLRSPDGQTLTLQATLDVLKPA